MAADFLETLSAAGGYWKHKPGQQYLAKLTSGKISDVFCNTGVITTDPMLLETAASDLMRKLKGVLPTRPRYIVGLAFGSITLAYELAGDLGVKAYFTEPLKITEAVKSIYESCRQWKFEPPSDWAELAKHHKGQSFRFAPQVGQPIMMVEDVMTTGDSLREAITVVDQALRKESTGHPSRGEGRIMNVVASLVNRSGSATFKDSQGREYKVVALADVTARTWGTLEEAQSEVSGVVDAIRPKENWSKLVVG